MKKKGIVILLILVICVAGAVGAYRILGTSKPENPVLTWIDDDTIPGSFENAYAIAKELNITMTFACVTDWLTEESTQTLLNYQSEGFQIVTHSASHDNTNIWGSNYSTGEVYDSELAEQDLQRSLETLKNAGFTDYDYFVTPGAVEFTEVRELSKKYCKGMIEAAYTTNMNIETIYAYDLHREFISVEDHADAAYYKDLIDYAYENNAWLIFGTHSGIAEQWDADLVKEVLQYAINKGFDVQTLAQGFASKVNLT